MLFSKDPGVAEAARRFGCVQYGARAHPEHGIPLMSHAFERAQQMASTKLMGFFNADLVLLDDFMPAVETVAAKFRKFLIVGQKTDLRMEKPLDFSGGWQKRLRERAAKEGKLHRSCGLDFFIFTTGLYREIPPFYIARTTWDNWLMWSATRRGIPVVDVSPSVLVAHPPRRGHRPGDGLTEYNRELGGKAGRWGRTEYAPWVLTKSGLEERDHEKIPSEVFGK